MAPVHYAPFLNAELSDAIQSLANLGSLLIQATQQRGTSRATQEDLCVQAFNACTEIGNQQAALKTLDAPDRREAVQCRDHIYECAKSVIRYLEPNDTGAPPISHKKAVKIAKKLAKTCRKLTDILGSSAPHLPSTARAVLTEMLRAQAENVLSAVSAVTPSALMVAANSAASMSKAIQATIASGETALALEEELASVPGLAPVEGRGFEQQRYRIYALLEEALAATRSSTFDAIFFARPDLQEEVNHEATAGVQAEEVQAEEAAPLDYAADLASISSDEEELSPEEEEIASLDTDPEMPPLEELEDDVFLPGEEPAEVQAPVTTETPGVTPGTSTASESLTPEDLEVAAILSVERRSVSERKRAAPEPEEETTIKKKKLASRRASLPQEGSREEQEKQEDAKAPRTGFFDVLLLRALDLAASITRGVLSVIQKIFNGEAVRNLFRRSSQQQTDRDDLRQVQERVRQRSASVPDLHSVGGEQIPLEVPKTPETRPVGVGVEARLGEKRTQTQKRSSSTLPPKQGGYLFSSEKIITQARKSRHHSDSDVTKPRIPTTLDGLLRLNPTPATPPSRRGIPIEQAGKGDKLLPPSAPPLPESTARGETKSTTGSKDPVISAPLQEQGRPTVPQKSSPETISATQVAAAATGLEGVTSQGTVQEGSVKAPGTGCTETKSEAPQR